MTQARTVFGMDGRTAVSTLWIVVMVNMAFADILSFITPGALGELAALNPSQGFILVSALLIEVPAAMIFLSRALGPRAGRVANLAAGLATAAWVVGGGSAYPHYIFMAGVELSCIAAIAAIAWRLPRAAAGEA